MAKIKTRNTDSHKTKPKDIAEHAFKKVYWPYIPIVLAISILLSVGAQSGSLAAYAKHPGGRVLSYATSMTISSLLADSNAQRTANGASSLNLNNKLDSAAQASADDMAARDYWSHNTPDGSPPWIWVNNQGYSYQKLGQNLATGFSDEQSTINGWMASPPHRENLLDPTYKDVGFGFANIPNYTAAGGGPMTIVVAFYGEPQVLAASTNAPTTPPASAPNTSSPAPTTSTTPPETSNSSPQQAPVNQTPVAKKPATTQTAQAELTPSVKSSRLQLVLGNSTTTKTLTSLSIFMAIALALLWFRRHILAIHKFLLKGERYAIRHPLTDIGLIIIACLLFIVSQTAGLIQ